MRGAKGFCAHLHSKNLKVDACLRVAVGAKVPADLRLIEKMSNTFRVDQVSG